MLSSRSSNPGVGHLASDKQVAANRRNAKKSTGPRTKSGKKEVSQNARKHGLSAGVIGDEVEEMTDLLSANLLEDQLSVPSRDEARDVCELQSITRRAREAKVELLKGADDPAKFPHILNTYQRIDRYERRALSRKKSILRTIA